MRLGEIASYIGATLVSGASGATGATAGEENITGVAPVETAPEGTLSFVHSGDFVRFIATTRASALILREKSPDFRGPQLLHENPYWAFAKAAQLFVRASRGPSGFSDMAFIADDAEVHESVTVYPFVFVGSGAKIGAECILYPGVYVGEGVEIGEGCHLLPNVVVMDHSRIGRKVVIHAGTVVGCEGFGYAASASDLIKVPQMGSVRIGDRVEIGSCSTIDRGTMSDTAIGEGTKLDSHVHIGHNSEIGSNTMICGMSATAGSVVIGDWVFVGGHTGINSRCVVPTRSEIGAMSGVTKKITKTGRYQGIPAIEASSWKRQVAYIRRIPAMEDRVRGLEAKLEALSDVLMRGKT
jgi:UDP-3-O-[3-hydroxymyristoyl] glucosamine N-acyltransferase